MPIELLIHLDFFGVSCRILETSSVEISAISMSLGLACVAQSAKSMHSKVLTPTSLLRNHGPLTRDNPQTLFHVGTILFLPNHTVKLRSRRRASTRGGEASARDTAGCKH